MREKDGTTDRIDDLITDLTLEFPALEVSAIDVFGRLVRINRLASAYYESALERPGLAALDGMVILALRRAGPPFQLTPGELIEDLVRPSSTMANAFDRMERNQLVVRRPDTRDRRSVQVELTQKGVTLGDELMRDLVETQLQMFAGLSERERSEIDKGLRTALRVFEQWTEAGPSIGWRARRKARELAKQTPLRSL